MTKTEATAEIFWTAFNPAWPLREYQYITKARHCEHLFAKQSQSAQLEMASSRKDAPRHDAGGASWCRLDDGTGHGLLAMTIRELLSI